MNADAVPFDKTHFLRQLRHASVELYRSVRAAEMQAAERRRLADAMVALVREAKRHARDMRPDEKDEFLGHVDKITKISGVPLEDPLIAAPVTGAAAKGAVFRLDIDVSRRERGLRKVRAEDPGWRMINLAIRSEPGATKRVFGIAERGDDYYVFDGEMGEAYQVLQTEGIGDARAIFSKALARGYREISPGSYVAMRLGVFPAV